MIVIGIDESYTCTGIALAQDNKILKYKKVDFKGCNNKSEKRKVLNRIIGKILKSLPEIKSDPLETTIIVCERIRTFSQKNLSANYFTFNINGMWE